MFYKAQHFVLLYTALTFRTILSSTLDFLLLPCLPMRVISNWQNGLGKISHCVKNLRHSTI